jgi:hypothetical protein
MSRAKTIVFFALIGPAAAALPCLVTILTLAAFHRDAQGIGIAVAALFMAYCYGLIPAGLCGVLFALYIRRHPSAISSSAAIVRLGVVAGFLSSLPVAAWAFLVTERVLVYDHVLMAGTFLVISIFSGAFCAVLWRKWASAAIKPAPLRKTMNSTPAN